jgi:hypothetical protein
MKKFSTRGVLRFAGAMAVCMFALPSAASAASWGPLSSHHTLDSPNLGFTSSFLGGTTSQCVQSSFTTRVTSAQNLEITSASFNGCTVSGPSIGTCTGTLVATRLPWTATAVTTSNLQIHGIHIDGRSEQPPGSNLCAAFAVGLLTTLTGTLTGGNYTSPGRLDFNNAEGLVTHSVSGNNVPLTFRALFTDTQGTLTVS